jgi:hypothetical protein
VENFVENFWERKICRLVLRKEHFGRKNAPLVENFFLVAGLHHRATFSTGKYRNKSLWKSHRKQYFELSLKIRRKTPVFSTGFQGFSKGQN